LFALNFTAQVGDAFVEDAFGDIVETDQDAGDAFAAVAGNKLDIKMLRMTSSSGSVMRFSMSMAEAPGRLVVT